MRGVSMPACARDATTRADHTPHHSTEMSAAPAAAARAGGRSASGRPGARGAGAPSVRDVNTSSPSPTHSTDPPSNEGKPTSTIAQDRARASRRQRFARRRELQQITSLERVRKCGVVPVGETGAPTVALVTSPDGSRTAGLSGLSTCGSVWACPQCSAKVAARRAEELTQVMVAIEKAGGSAHLMTLTMRHGKNDRLGLSRQERSQRDRRITELRRRLDELGARGEQAPSPNRAAGAWSVLIDDDDLTVREDGRSDAEREADAIEEASIRDEIAKLRRSGGLWDALSYAWGCVTSGKAWTVDQERFGGLLGWARVTEVTDGDNGWHTHCHILLAWREKVSAEAVELVAYRAWKRWDAALRRRGLDSLPEYGLDVRAVRRGSSDDLAEYFLKAAHELTSAHKKEGRRGGRTPMQLLAQAVETYEESTVARWWEWEAASDGRRQLEWSRGSRSLRSFAELGEEDSDEEVAAEDLDGDEHLGLTPETWSEIRRQQWEHVLLEKAEDHGMDGLRAWLAWRGLSWVEGEAAPQPTWRHRPYWSEQARRVLSLSRMV